MKKEILGMIKEGVQFLAGLIFLLFWGCFLCAIFGLATPENMHLNENANIIQVAFELFMTFITL